MHGLIFETSNWNPLVSNKYILSMSQDFVYILANSTIGTVIWVGVGVLVKLVLIPHRGMIAMSNNYGMSALRHSLILMWRIESLVCRHKWPPFCCLDCSTAWRSLKLLTTWVEHCKEKQSISTAEGQSVAELTVKTLKSDENFKAFFWFGKLLPRVHQ